jgi:hypothetical protein
MQSSQQESDPANWMSNGGYTNGWKRFRVGLVERGGQDGVAVGEGGRSGRSVESPFARYGDAEPAAVAGGSVLVCLTLPSSRY